MPESLGSLKETPLVMHRIHFELVDTKAWYKIMQEARTMFGKNWKCQPRVKRKFERNWGRTPQRVWFDVPDPAFGTWVAIKHAVTVASTPNK
jgi:hypothetical protein